MARLLPVLASLLSAVLLLAGCSAGGGGEDSTTVVVTRSPGETSAAAGGEGAAPADQGGGSAAAPAAPVAPVEGAYPGAGGPRPANAEALPTFTSAGGVTTAYLKTPSGGIGCDLSESFQGNQGGCSVNAYRTSKLYGCLQTGSSCTPNTMFPLKNDRVEEITAVNGPMGWQDSYSHPQYQTQTVAYGKVVYFDDWTCASESNGLTCWNTSTGSGVFLSDERAERFEGPGEQGTQAPAAGAAPAQSGGEEIVLGSLPNNGEGYGTSRPSKVYNGGSTAGMTDQITWSNWGGERAEGTGRGYNPQGAVADGAPRNTSVRLVAFEIGQCNGRKAYRKLAVYSEGGSFDPANAQNVCWTER